MPEAKLIEKYFPNLTDRQREQFAIMLKEYPEWNSKINVISRKDIENLECNHLLHSLALARFITLTPGSKVMDLGCGGGLPGLPLAVMFPEVSFHLIDRTGKKIHVAQEIAKACGLTNVTFQHGDVAECKDKFDFVVSRAVMPQSDLIKICRKNISKEQRNALPNGLITLKGGDISGEMKGAAAGGETVEISQYFEEPFFKTKKVAYSPVKGN
ncbi:MAG: 16S rRNA (guanine(527)-N(7))-methyltransferase RsmG [Muribaculaceae bacterium]|nr:16S rRNA (guanine(527)-N(7))-methyltransferase RsmG [Muribaculaceae bacterium]